MSKHTYLVALGSNQCHHLHGSPREVIATALDLFVPTVGKVRAQSSIIETAPIGPSLRRYANAAALVDTQWSPPDMLAALQGLEQVLGRERRGQRWRSRTIDCDIVLWNGGCWSARDLTIPHPLFRDRDFVLGPAAQIAGGWKDPVSGFTLRQLHARLTRRRPLPR